MDETDTFAPVGMGAEYVSRPRKPLSEYVGASEELAAFPGGVIQAWDPMDFSLLYKVSGNNPDVAFLREAELKHGRIAMLAFAVCSRPMAVCTCLVTSGSTQTGRQHGAASAQRTLPRRRRSSQRSAFSRARLRRAFSTCGSASPTNASRATAASTH